MSWPKEMLMVEPTYFEIAYQINPHMVDAEGNLNKVNKERAQAQWRELNKTFSSLVPKVHSLAGGEGLPDMVFCANQTFPFIKENQRHIVLSKMASPNRQPEVAFFKTWAQSEDIICHEIEAENFEGMGDALWNYETGQLFAGYGFRTSPETYNELEKIIGQRIVTFELKDDRFYHLDTCLSILSGDTAAYVEEAFTQEGLETLKKSFTKLIAVPIDEAINQLACNMCTPNGKDVVIQRGAIQTNKLLEEAGFNVIEVDTDEYIKSGGSVFCMKQLLF